MLAARFETAAAVCQLCSGSAEEGCVRLSLHAFQVEYTHLSRFCVKYWSSIIKEEQDKRTRAGRRSDAGFCCFFRGAGRSIAKTPFQALKKEHHHQEYATKSLYKRHHVGEADQSSFSIHDGPAYLRGSCSLPRQRKRSSQHRISHQIA